MNKIIAQSQALNRIARVWPMFIRRLSPGRTERQAARLLYRALRQAGFTRWAFPVIVAAGPSAAEPHHKPTNRRIRADQFVKIDFGVIHRGWRTDVTRTIVLGRPSRLQLRLFALVQRTQSAAAAALKPGVTGQAIDAIARGIITRARYGKYFIHSTGHGVGRAIHELPYLSPGPKGHYKLKIGDVVTVEPGIYIPNRLGIRIEDMYVITKTGRRCLSNKISRSLTPTPSPCT